MVRFAGGDRGVSRRRGRRGGEPVGPALGYGVGCSAQFSGGWSMNDGAPVEGTPPAEADRASAEETLAEG